MDDPVTLLGVNSVGLCNEHGHSILVFPGFNFTGEQEVELLEAHGYRVDPHARSCFLSTNKDSYDSNHRLELGRTYMVALVPTKEIPDSNRTITTLRQLRERYGYEKPRGGLIPRIRKMLSDNQMQKLGYQRIVSLHDPIENPDGHPFLLDSRVADSGHAVGACSAELNCVWGDASALAFPLPKSAAQHFGNRLLC
jgi:hypothetical protein